MRAQQLGRLACMCVAAADAFAGTATVDSRCSVRHQTGRECERAQFVLDVLEPLAKPSGLANQRIGIWIFILEHDQCDIVPVEIAIDTQGQQLSIIII